MVMPSLISELDADTIRDNIIARVQGAVPSYVPDESDFVYVTASELARLLYLALQEANAQARQLLVRFAIGDSLDELGALVGVTRDTDENDTEYRARIMRNPASFGGVGSSAFIETTALNRTDVSDVLVVPRANGQDIDVYIQGQADDTRTPATNPTDAVVTAVNTYMNASNRVLAGWSNIVSRPTYSAYSVAVTYTWRGSDPSAAIRAAVYAFIDAHTRLDTPVYVSGLVAAVINAGAVRASVTLNGASSDLLANIDTGTVYYAAKTTANVTLTGTEEA